MSGSHQRNKSGRKALAPLSQQRCMKKMKQGHCPNETSTASLCLQMLQTFAQISRHSKSLRLERLVGDIFETSPPVSQAGGTKTHGRSFPRNGLPTSTSAKVLRAPGTKTHGRSFP